MACAFILDNIATPIISSFFTVVGGAMPVAILIYLFSIKEKKSLKGLAEAKKQILLPGEKLVKKMLEVTEQEKDLEKKVELFERVIQLSAIIEEEKKFIKYAESYNFISSIGHILRMNNYMPKNMEQHKEISKLLQQ